MTYITKPRVRHPSLTTNAIGLTRRDYEGSMSTLCAGCGHDSITAAVIQAAWGMNLEPHRVAKLSGIGCSSKTPTYFIGQAHGFNSVHGRMPSIATGAQAAHPELTYIGVSGDGDSLAIGLGQLCHVIRRNVDMLYILENNGVYGLTKGQFSASADVGTKAKRGQVNRQPPIDPVLLALGLGATFVARGFSGDKAQLVPILEAGIRHKGFAFVDVISPCVAFNDHEGSTKSYRYTREHMETAVEADLVLPMAEITTSYEPGTARRGPSSRRQLSPVPEGPGGLRSGGPGRRVRLRTRPAEGRRDPDGTALRGRGRTRPCGHAGHGGREFDRPALRSGVPRKRTTPGSARGVPMR